MIRNVILVVFTCLVLLCSAESETVDGITWTYTVANDVASVGHEAHYYTAISTSTSGAIVIPAILGGKPVTSIGAYAFLNCSNLTDVTIPHSVTNIGMHAFHNCTQITSITIPEMVSEIGMCAFCGCTGLVTVNIPAAVTNIESMIFYHCQKITNVVSVCPSKG